MNRKRIILIAATFLLGFVAYWGFSAGDRKVQPRTTSDATRRVRQFVSRPTTQAVQTISDADITFSPGDLTRVRVYDDISGRLKYVFEAKSWEPISQTDFHLRDLLIQIFMPRGEITYISSDEAEVTLARKARSRVDPRRGWLKGHVQITIDRTTSAWREANPHLADRFAHPDDLINIQLPEAKFDMDSAELIADGDVLVDSVEAKIENVRGLTLQWDQVDNRIDVLRFNHGGRMALRRGGGMVDFAMPGTTRSKSSKRRSGGGAATSQSAREAIAAQIKVPHAQVNTPMSIDVPSAEEAASEIRLEGGVVAANTPMSIPDSAPPVTASQPATPPGALRSPDALAADVDSLRTEARAGASGDVLKSDVLETVLKKSAPKVHTYRAVFTNQVVVEQKDGLRTIGKIEADKLEINFDFGKKQRALASGRPTGGEKPAAEANAGKPTSRPDRAAPIDAAGPEDKTKLVLTWDGPLELRPIRVDPAEQTGQRFDAIATGKIVKLQSEQGSGSCAQLVYRHERRQVWLSGNGEQTVEMAVSPTRRLTGHEIFFDQRRGLGRIDGAGMMIDERLDGAGDANPAEAFAALSGSPRESPKAKAERPPVQIRWAHGVDLEVGTRDVDTINPATGLKETKNKEFLRRAWFHGDVSIVQGDETLSADQVAVTFGLPMNKEEVADHIQHLNMTGAVKLSRADELISAERLDVEMTITPDGRNIPRFVDAAGKVLAQQGRREVRADQMQVALNQFIPPEYTAPDGRMIQPKPRLGMESIDATGDVYINDPDQNLKISRAQRLQAKMRDGNKLIRSTIIGSDPDQYAWARFSEAAIHGHHIDIDVDGQAVDVPGPGSAWMLTDQDFGGRKLNKSTAVKTTWRDHMQFRLNKNYGIFVGKVHSESDAFSMNCDKMTVRFGRTPPPPEKTEGKSKSRGFWTLGPITNDKAEVKRVEVTGPIGVQKRPVYIVAEGHAEALSSNYTTPDPGGVARLKSRARIAADQIAVDLLAQQMSVPFKGTLLIEDYQLDENRPKSGTPRDDSGPAIMNAMRSDGPSQTLVTWENSMDYFVDRNLVAFDRGVSMVHRSGQEMVLKGQLAAAMNLDVEKLKHMSKGKRATLSCGNLLLEFTGGTGNRYSAADPLIRATDLNRLIAKGAVHFQEDTKSLMGEHLQYLRGVNEIRLEGSERLEARIIDQDERSQRLSMWKGPILIWDRKTNRIEAPQATITSSRR